MGGSNTAVLVSIAVVVVVVIAVGREVSKYLYWILVFVLQ